MASNVSLFKCEISKYMICKVDPSEQVLKKLYFFKWSSAPIETK